jgi:prevent-host-death family protein
VLLLFVPDRLGYLSQKLTSPFLKLYISLNLGLAVTIKYSESIKPISYIKTHLAKIVRNLKETQSPMIITQNGEAKAVVIDINPYEQMQESMAMLELIAQGKKNRRRQLSTGRKNFR